MAMYPLENCFLAGNWPGSEAVLHMSGIDSDADFIFNEQRGKTCILVNYITRIYVWLM